MRRGGTGLPETIIMCAPCLAADKRRKLLEFDLGPDGPSVRPYTDDGKRVLPRWSGPDGGGKVHRTCGCGNHAQASRAAILEALEGGVPVLYR